MMFRSLFPLLLLASFLQAMDGPTTPYYDWKACPGEGCVYAKWTAKSGTALYRSLRDERPIATIQPGEKVLALTGVVVTLKPGIVHVDRDLPARQIKAGDSILTYAPRGEGNWAAWVNGNYKPDYDLSFVTWPDGSGCQNKCAAKVVDAGQYVWWAQVKLRSALVGWVNMDKSEFDGTCALALQR